MGNVAQKRLPPEKELEALDHAIEGDLSLNDIARTMGLRGRASLSRYLIAFPEFRQKFDDAMYEGCRYLEEKMLNAAQEHDPKTAGVMVTAISRILKYRDPKKYGDKLDMNVNQTIDISGALNRAERVVGEMNSVTSNVVQIATAKKIDQPD